MSNHLVETFLHSHPRYLAEHVLYLRGGYRDVYVWAHARGIALEIVCTAADLITVVLVPDRSARLLLQLQFSYPGQDHS
jgi:hypothetical protein